MPTEEEDFKGPFTHRSRSARFFQTTDEHVGFRDGVVHEALDAKGRKVASSSLIYREVMSTMQNYPTPFGEDFDLHFGMIGMWTPITVRSDTIPKTQKSAGKPEEKETKKAAP
ncbi:MAG TPA: hypothetical protein VJG29_00170 [Candidatus Paceibacterota bacterium]